MITIMIGSIIYINHDEVTFSSLLSFQSGLVLSIIYYIMYNYITNPLKQVATILSNLSLLLTLIKHRKKITFKIGYY